MKRFRAYFIIIAVCAIVVVVAWFSYSSGRKSALYPEIIPTPVEIADVHPLRESLSLLSPMAEQEIAPELGGEFIAFPDEAFKIQVPKWWKSVDVKKFPNTSYKFRGIQKVFVSDEEQCALIYSGAPEEPFGQSHFINSISVTANGEPFANISALRNILLAFAPDNPATTTPGLTFMGGGMHEPYLPYEFASFFIQGSGQRDTAKGFHLVSTNEKPLSPKCESETRSILQTFTREFATGTLENTEGLALIASDVTTGGANRGYSFFLTREGAGILKIFDLPKDASRLTFSSSEDSLYYITNDERHGMIKKHFLKDGSIDTKEFSDASGGLSLPDGTILVDFFLSHDSIYYLAGTPGCMEYKGACTTSLFLYDIRGNSSRAIASKLDRSSIIGVSKEVDEILLASFFGDGGCWSNTYTRIRLSDTSATGAGTFSGCVDESGASQNSAEQRGEDELTSHFGGNRFRSLIYALTLKNGTLTPFVEKESTPWFDRETTKIGERFHISSIPMRVSD